MLPCPAACVEVLQQFILPNGKHWSLKKHPTCSGGGRLESFPRTAGRMCVESDIAGTDLKPPTLQGSMCGPAQTTVFKHRRSFRSPHVSFTVRVKMFSMSSVIVSGNRSDSRPAKETVCSGLKRIKGLSVLQQNHCLTPSETPFETAGLGEADFLKTRLTRCVQVSLNASLTSSVSTFALYITLSL